MADGTGRAVLSEKLRRRYQSSFIQSIFASAWLDGGIRFRFAKLPGQDISPLARLGSEDLDSSNGLPRFRVLAGQDHAVVAAVTDRIKAHARIESTINSRAALLTISVVAPIDPDGPNLQYLLIDAKVDLAPDATSGAAVPARAARLSSQP